MSTLIVISYDSPLKAEEVRLQLLQMQKEYLVDVEDAVVATKDDKNQVKLNQMYHLTAAGAASGGFWGLLIGILFMNPILGIVAGAGTGAVAGALTDVGINDDFMKKIAAQLVPGSSMLFVLLRNITFDKFLDELKGTGGNIIQTSLSHTDEQKLQKMIDEQK